MIFAMNMFFRLSCFLHCAASWPGGRRRQPASAAFSGDLDELDCRRIVSVELRDAELLILTDGIYSRFKCARPWGGVGNLQSATAARGISARGRPALFFAAGQIEHPDRLNMRRTGPTDFLRRRTHAI
jgi:hypothetical protein